MRTENDQKVNSAISVAPDRGYKYSDRADPAPTVPAPVSGYEFDDSTAAPCDLTAPLGTIESVNPTPDTPISEYGASLIETLIVNRYFIERKLGQGAVGVVYLGQDRRLLNKPVVVKILLETSLKNEWVVQKFWQEKEALTRANHPGIVGILDAGELPDGKPFIVMEYIDGVTLHSAIPAEGMSLTRAGRLIKQIGSALAAAHDKGILHRDLKPDNIMLQTLSGGEEQVRIIDFGIAKVRDSLVANNTMVPGTVGTLRYMSPEQLRAEPLTPASDIYSMGVIAYQMITGRCLFDPKTIAELIDMHRAGVQIPPRRFRDDLSVPAQKLILKALSYEPRDRFQSATEFGEAFEQALTAPTNASGHRRLRFKTPNISSWRDQISSQRRPIAIVIAVAVIVPVSLTSVILLLPTRTDFKRKSTSSVSKPVAQVDTSTIAPPAPAPQLAENSFTYWLRVQRMPSGKADGSSSDSSGQGVFQNGDKFELNLFSPKQGFLYVMNEGQADRGESSLTMLYPAPGLERGTPKVEEGRTVRLPVRFGGQPGIEQFWMIWSTTPITELEGARKAAFKNNVLRLADERTIQSVRDFLSSHAQPEPEAKTGDTNKTVIIGRVDPLVKLLKLQHQ